MNQDPRVDLLKGNIEKIVTGKENVVKMAIVTLLARGHLLIEDVPGVGKTTLAQALAHSVDCSFKRIQFTSDLLPSDILGVSIFNQGKQQFDFTPGPIFSNIILADEINRTTPKTQSCLLESMSESKVSIENRTFTLPQPFMVIATQNPVEYHGTYPLPESQLDRFMICLKMGYPSIADEKKILLAADLAAAVNRLSPVLSSRDVVELQEKVLQVKMDEALVDYIMALVDATRSSDRFNLGVSTRGAIFLFRAAQSLAFVEGRGYGIPDDVKRLAPLVFSHRVILNHDRGAREEEAVSEILNLLNEIPVPF